MANFTLEITSFRQFVSQVTPSKDLTEVDLQRFQREVELYLRELLRVIQADLQDICDNCCPTGSP